MPYEIRKVEKGWKVFTKGTDRSHSNDPLPLKRAKEQLKALYANADDEEKMKGGMIGGFDDRDWDKLFGLYGGADEDADGDEQAKADAEAIIRLEDEKAFDVEEATGEPEYLKQAKAFAKKAGYKDYADLRLADDGKHKLVLRGVKFGSINNNDYIIYKQHFKSIAEKKRKQYLARATKIKGDWAKNKYSPNSLAINILWDGSSKKGGMDGEDELDRQMAEHKKEWDLLKLKNYDDRYKAIAEDIKQTKLLQLNPTQQQLVRDGTYIFPRDILRQIGDETEARFRAEHTPERLAEYEELKRKYPDQRGSGYSGGAVPLNKKLYEQAKAEVYPRYKKPSAYRSGAVVKRYKELGGKFKDNGGRPLARWFKEEWKDVGNKEYPVYRPTKRISKDTPLTPQEIDPENLRLQITEKQKIKGESNLSPFKERKVGGRLAQTDAEELKEAKQILNKVAGEGNPKVKEISETPMGDDNIRKYLPNAKILKYSELADIQDITQLLPQPKSYFFLLYEHAPNNGHWCSVNRYINNGKDTIAFFCSYGSKIDGPLYWNSQGRNQELGQERPYLSQLLRKAQQAGKNIEYNKVQYQSKKSPVATCGAFAVLWIKANLRENMSLQDFHDWIAEIKSETGLSYDAIASNAISQRTF